MKYLKELNSWIDIPDFENCYQIHSNGLVKNLSRKVNGYNGFKVKKEKLCKPFVKNGYLAVALSKGGKVKQFTIHRLLALLFISNPENKPTVNHIDGNKQNNDLVNLEWATQSEQLIHANKTGLFKSIPPTKKGDKLSQSTKDKMSKSRMGRIVTQETRDKIAESLRKKIIHQMV